MSRSRIGLFLQRKKKEKVGILRTILFTFDDYYDIFPYQNLESLQPAVKVQL